MIHEKYKSQNVEVTLISLDLPNQVEKGLKRFVEKKNLQSRVIHLNDPDQNTWIPKVDPDWDGAIPATMIYSASGSAFFVKSFTQEELENEIKKHL